MYLKRTKVSRAVSAHLLGLVVASATVPGYAQEEGETKKESELEVIEVTAQKRIQNLQEVPVSVTAINGDYIRESELQTFADIVSLAPGITLDQGAETRTTSISIRGVGSSQNNMGIEPSTTMMVDGEVLPRSSALNGDLMDTERAEVLRGPQGTLFGKNTSSGIVHFISKRPEFNDQFGRMKFSTDQYGLKKASMAYNYSDSDTFALRANIAWSDTDGFMKNWKPGHEDIGKRDSKGARIQFLFKPVEELELLFRAEKKESSNNCCGSTIISVDENMLFNAHLNHPAVKDFVQKNTGWGKMDTYMSDTQVSDIDNTGLSFEANYDLGDYTLTYAAHKRDWELFNNTEMAGATLDVSELYFGGVNGFDSTQHELRLTTNGGGKVEFVTGLFYQKVDQLRDASEAMCTTTAKASFWSLENWEPGNEANDGNPTDFDINGNLLACRGGFENTIIPGTEGGLYNFVDTYRTTVDSVNKAVFGQFDFHLSDKFTAFVGARYLEETSELYYEGGRDASKVENKKLNGKKLNAADLAVEGFNYNAKNKDSHFIYRLGGQYQFNDDLMVYASYGTGYKGVGWYNAISNKPSDIADPEKNPVSPEKSKSVELGIRSDWLENRLRLNASLFRTEYEDFQERVREIDESGESYEDGTLIGNPLFVNAGKVVSKGLEMEMTALVSDNLTLTGTAAYIDAYYDEFGNFFQNCPAKLKGTSECTTFTAGNGKPLEVLILDGRQLARAPKTQFRIDARYDFDLLDHESFVRLGYRWKDNIQYRFDHNPDTEHPSFGLLDVFFGMNGEWGDKEYQISFFVKNALDETYYSRIAARSGQHGGGLRGIVSKDSQRYVGASFSVSF